MSSQPVIDLEQSIVLELIRRVLGKWRGDGFAAFPTIPTFDYREELEFAGNEEQPFLRYEERSWKKMETGRYAPSHWETGFWRALPTGEIEVVSAQGGGRVEVLRGPITPTSGGFTLNLQSVLEGNDARMDKTKRQFVLEQDELQYSMQMSTTSVRDLTSHLRVSLRKA